MSSSSSSLGADAWANLVTEIRDGVNVLTEERQVQGDVIEELQVSLAEGFQSISELVANQTAAIGNLATELNVLKGRQAASAALQVIQFLLFAGYLITLAVNYVVKKCRKHSKKRGEETVELLEQRLQERKSRRRAAAARQSSADK